ncbi:hypothetical protein GCM10011359_07570 [Nesterenkonia alkaliphila]|nr:hypothetical protein GCM10011359_07570 [Nesterenkonia alkaliphila]
MGSRSQQSAQQFAAEFGIAQAHGSYQELVENDAVDIVYVATPHPMHYEPTMLAIAAGKHVLVEKPFMLNRTQAEQVREAARAKNLLVTEAMWTRYLPHMVRIRQLIASGAIGEVRALFADHAQSFGSDPTHRINALELGGGALLDLGVYPVSFAWDVLGAPNQCAGLRATRRYRCRHGGRGGDDPRIRGDLHLPELLSGGRVQYRTYSGL